MRAFMRSPRVIEVRYDFQADADRTVCAAHKGTSKKPLCPMTEECPAKKTVACAQPHLSRERGSGSDCMQGKATVSVSRYETSGPKPASSSAVTPRSLSA